MQRANLALAPLSAGVLVWFGCGASPAMNATGNAAQGGGSATTVTTSSMAGRTSVGQVTPPRTTTTAPPTTASGSPSNAGGPAQAGSPAAASNGGAGHSAAPNGASAGNLATAAGSGGHAAAAGSGGSASTANAAGAMAAAGNSSLTGNLGALGDVKPIMAGWATTNGLETLIYLSSAPLTCEMMMTRGVKWLSKLPAGSQVIEIVVGTPPAAKTYNLGTSAALGGGEVNYAEGSKSSSTEVTGRSGSITLTTATASGVQEGTIDVGAPFIAKGKFHAEWCEGGTEY